MKNNIVLLIVLVSFFAKAQEVSLGKSLNSVQLCLFSLSFQNEFKLDRKITLRSEIGLATGNSTATFPDGHKEKSFLIIPFVNLEPRWYYGLDRRSRLNRNTANNSSNYFSLLTTYVSSRTALVNTKDFEVAPFVSIVPEYGFRRSFGKNFFWDSSAGIRYQHNFFDNSFTYTINENHVVFNIQ